MEIPKMMRFAVLMEKGKVEVHERPIPELGDEDVLIRQESCNICTTDYQQYMGLREHQGYPMAFGHEGSGHIIAVGRKVKEFAVGDHVALSNRSCGYCKYCRSGLEGFCPDNTLDYWSEDGYKGALFGMGDYNVVAARRVFKISDDLQPGEGGFLEPLATVCKGMRLLKAEHEDTIVVIGAGTMGMLNAITLRAMGHRVIITEYMPNKIENAREEGLEVIDCNAVDPVEEVKRLTGGRGADAVIVAVGATSANTQAIQMLKEYYGKVLFFAASFPEPKLEISSNLPHYRLMTFQGTFSADMKDYVKSAELLSSGRVSVKRLLEKTNYRLDQIDEAFKEACTPGKYRVTVLL